MKPKVYATFVLPKPAKERIEAVCDLRTWDGKGPIPREVLSECIRDVEGLVTGPVDKVDAELIDKASKLRVISNYAVGYDNIDVDRATRRGIIVGNTPDVLTDTTADLAFALMLAAARRVVESDREVRSGNWKPETWDPMNLLGQDVHDAALGIIGLGRIGIAVARRAKGFGMTLLYYSRTRKREIEKELGIRYVEFEELLAGSDFITIHVNLTPQTRHLIGRRELEKMKATCVLVNTSRGSVVDNMALYDALREGKIAFAALDVTEPEPLPTDHPLLSLTNVVVTPHIGSASVTTRNKMGVMAAQNLIAGLEGKMLPNPVNPKALGGG